MSQSPASAADTGGAPGRRPRGLPLAGPCSRGCGPGRPCPGSCTGYRAVAGRRGSRGTVGLVGQHPILPGTRVPAAGPGTGVRRSSAWNCGLSSRWPALIMMAKRFRRCSHTRWILVVGRRGTGPGRDQPARHRRRRVVRPADCMLSHDHLPLISTRHREPRQTRPSCARSAAGSQSRPGRNSSHRDARPAAANASRSRGSWGC